MSLPGNNYLTVKEEIISLANSVQTQPSADERTRFIFLINQLINHDFNTLIRLLYQIDVSEKKLNQVLKNNVNTDSAPLIVDLIIERQLQKIESRKIFTEPEWPKTDEEKW